MRKIQFLLVLFICFSLSLFGKTAPKINIGDAVPDFALTDVDGKLVRLSDFKGKVVVLEWTNPNCPFVQRVYSDEIMQKVQKKAQESHVVWLVINSTHPEHRDYEQPDELKKIYAEWNALYTHFLLDPTGKVGKMFDAKTTPHMFIIDANGKLVYNGAIDDDPRGRKEEKVNYVEQALSELLAGKQITTPQTRPYGCSVKYKD